MEWILFSTDFGAVIAENGEVELVYIFFKINTLK